LHEHTDINNINGYEHIPYFANSYEITLAASAMKYGNSKYSLYSSFEE